MTYIIAEAGTNHAHHQPEERWSRAIDLINAAHRAGADAVKFQVFWFASDPLFCPYEGDDKRWPRWADSELHEDKWLNLAWRAQGLGIDLLLSVFQLRGVELLKRLKLRYIKVASRAAAVFPYSELPGPFLVSTGMGINPPVPPLDQVMELLQCSMKYPTPLDEAAWIGDWIPSLSPQSYAGLSDHSGTVWPGLDAIFHGARFLEVHFNLGAFDAGPDKPVCLTTDQLKLLCEARDAAAKMHRDPS